MARILIFGEGANDIGRREWCVRADDYVVSEGWLQPIVRRLRSSSGSEVGVRLRELVSLPGRAGGGPRSGLAVKARLAKLRAATEGCVAVVLATDADSIHPREHARKEADFNAGFAGDDTDVCGIPCVPMGVSEAWLLADKSSWATLGATTLGRLPPRPETSWGTVNDPDAGHPKQVFAKICEDNDLADNTNTRAQLAEICNVDTMHRLLPVSFSRFESDLAAV